MKTFSDLEPGDKIFEIFEHGKSTGIYELREIVQNGTHVLLHVDTIVAPFERFDISINTEIYKQANFYSFAYDSVVFANEEEFLDILKNDKPLLDFM